MRPSLADRNLQISGEVRVRGGDDLQPQSADNSYLNDQNNIEVASFTTADLQYSIALDGLIAGESTTVRVGLNNVFDKDPPSIGLRTWPGYDETVHDVRGRVAYLSLRHQF